MHHVKLVLSMSLLASPAISQEQEEHTRVTHPSQCVEIASSKVYEDCRRAFETGNFFEYPKRLQLYASTPPAAAPAKESGAQDDRSVVEKHLQTIAVATTITAIVSAGGAVLTLIMLLSL